MDSRFPFPIFYFLAAKNKRISTSTGARSNQLASFNINKQSFTTEIRKVNLELHKVFIFSVNLCEKFSVDLCGINPKN
ncbi:hypothetical protein DMB68_11290 [Flavobacterium hydrophilum]|uniref:Uncharacterized protein n=1 Tax=Flavobacterium hydrophilum TaxID=2211445 RepID=A0A2V4C1S3_9FLAO|nr:hypothetical protein DMB68_11290 [Flavobacterium hydrophilum]